MQATQPLQPPCVAACGFEKPILIGFLFKFLSKL
jgi:hypothetical protein